MRLEYKDINSLIEAEYNPRQISKDDFKQLKTSLKSFDCVEPAVVNVNPDRFNVIVGGHQRIKAAKALRWTKFPCVEVDLDIEREKELNVRLNKNTGVFDYDILANNFDLGELVGWGFNADDFSFLTTEPDPETITKQDDKEKISVCKQGDVWHLGDHKLKCSEISPPADCDAIIQFWQKLKKEDAIREDGTNYNFLL